MRNLTGFKLTRKLEVKYYQCESLEVANDLIEFHQMMNNTIINNYKIEKIDNPNYKVQLTLHLSIKAN